MRFAAGASRACAGTVKRGRRSSLSLMHNYTVSRQSFKRWCTSETLVEHRAVPTKEGIDCNLLIARNRHRPVLGHAVC